MFREIRITGRLRIDELEEFPQVELILLAGLRTRAPGDPEIGHVGFDGFDVSHAAMVRIYFGLQGADRDFFPGNPDEEGSIRIFPLHHIM